MLLFHLERYYYLGFMATKSIPTWRKIPRKVCPNSAVKLVDIWSFFSQRCLKFRSYILTSPKKHYHHFKHTHTHILESFERAIVARVSVDKSSQEFHQKLRLHVRSKNFKKNNSAGILRWSQINRTRPYIFPNKMAVCKKESETLRHETTFWSWNWLGLDYIHPYCVRLVTRIFVWNHSIPCLYLYPYFAS